MHVHYTMKPKKMVKSLADCPSVVMQCGGGVVVVVVVVVIVVVVILYRLLTWIRSKSRHRYLYISSWIDFRGLYSHPELYE